MKNCTNKNITLKKASKVKNPTSAQIKTKSFCVCEKCFSEKCPYLINMTATSSHQIAQANTSTSSNKKKNVQSNAPKDLSLLQLITNDDICICGVFARAFQSNVNVQIEPIFHGEIENDCSNNQKLCHK